MVVDLWCKLTIWFVKASPASPPRPCRLIMWSMIVSQHTLCPQPRYLALIPKLLPVCLTMDPGASRCPTIMVVIQLSDQ
jgi:hypothetical protein